MYVDVEENREKQEEKKLWFPFSGVYYSGESGNLNIRLPEMRRSVGYLNFH